MKKIYYLSSCTTCKRIMDELELPDTFEKQDIKKEPLTEIQLDELHQFAGSYEALFSRRAQLYKKRNLKEQNLVEKDIKNLLLEHYTFLKRPVIVVENEVFIGNSKKTVAAAHKAID